MTVAIASITPWFAVRSYDRAQAFYCAQLGFEWQAEGGDPATLGLFGLGAARIGVQEPDANTPEAAIGWGRAEIAVEGVDALHDRFLAAGVEIATSTTMGPEDTEGVPIAEEACLHSFTLCDPDGNQIEFRAADDEPEDEDA